MRLIEDKCEGEKLVDEVKLTVLVEDSVDMYKPDLLAKHGLSFFCGSPNRGCQGVNFDGRGALIRRYAP